MKSIRILIAMLAGFIAAIMGPPMALANAPTGPKAAPQAVKPPEREPRVVIETVKADVIVKATGARRPAPKLIPLRQKRPKYPGSLAARGIEGEVIVEFTIGVDGNPENIAIVSASHQGFRSPVTRVVRQWKHLPTVLGGTAYEVRVRTRVLFLLSGFEGLP